MRATISVAEYRPIGRKPCAALGAAIGVILSVTAEGLGIAVPVGAGVGCLLGTIVGEALDNRTPAPPKAPAAEAEE